MNFFSQVYALTRQIPSGFVTTYGAVATALGTKDLPADAAHQALQAGARNARIVGWALHANKDLNTPCHRVVAKEGVAFLDREHVNLNKHLFHF